MAAEMTGTLRIWLPIAAVPMLGAVAVATAADPELDRLRRYGEQLSQECVACHRSDGKDVGIPGIFSMSEAEFVNAMMLYKTGRRKNKVMVSVTGSLDDTQIRALAIYFTSAQVRK